MPRKPEVFRIRRVVRPTNTATRPAPSRRGYGRTWQRLRLMVLAEEPLCRPCRAEGRVTPAEHVDHDVALEAGGTNDRENLVPMCAACHSRKTVQRDGGLGHAPTNGGSNREA